MPSLSIQICLAVPSLKNARQFVNSERSIHENREKSESVRKRGAGGGLKRRRRKKQSASLLARAPMKYSTVL